MSQMQIDAAARSQQTHKFLWILFPLVNNKITTTTPYPFLLALSKFLRLSIIIWILNCFDPNSLT